MDENLRQNDREILNKGGWGRAKRAPSGLGCNFWELASRGPSHTHFGQPFWFRLRRVGYFKIKYLPHLILVIHPCVTSLDHKILRFVQKSLVGLFGSMYRKNKVSEILPERQHVLYFQTLVFASLTDFYWIPGIEGMRRGFFRVFPITAQAVSHHPEDQG